MNTFFNLLALQAVIVFIVDISGIVDAIKAALGRWLGINIGRLRPFDCSLCVMFWAGIAYIAIAGRFTLAWLAVVCMLAFLSDIACSILRLVKDIIIKLINKIY